MFYCCNTYTTLFQEYCHSSLRQETHGDIDQNCVWDKEIIFPVDIFQEKAMTLCCVIIMAYCFRNKGKSHCEKDGVFKSGEYFFVTVIKIINNTLIEYSPVELKIKPWLWYQNSLKNIYMMFDFLNDMHHVVVHLMNVLASKMMAIGVL